LLPASPPLASINKSQLSQNAVVVSKDRDFLDSHLLTGSPTRLLMVATEKHR